MITVISCTNRTPSHTRLISEYYQSLLISMDQKCQILDLKDLPEDFLFTALYDKTGKDERFNKFSEIILRSDKFVFIVPEYNGSFPGVLKAFIDGLEFPSGFSNKKAALVGISSGSMAGALALSHLTDILNYLGMNVLAIKPRLPKINFIYNDGNITDTFLKNLLKSQAEALINF